MKTFWSILGGMAMLALLLAVPVRSEMVTVSDSDLSGITGKSVNSLSFSGTANTSIEATGDNSANIQTGWFQWNDRHDADTSVNKGGNNQSGDNSAVQQNVTADSNVINWGAAATLTWVTGSGGATGTIAQMPYAVMGVGGF
jgi:hypothetical protein